MQIVQKDQWYTGCCYLDLYKAEEDDELPNYFRVWDTEKEALEELLKEETDEQRILEIRQRIITI